MIVKVKYFSYRSLQVCFFIIIKDFREKIAFPDFALYSASSEILKKKFTWILSSYSRDFFLSF